MNEQAADVLKHIADKLDVPVQQLWAGMIAYAPFTFWPWVAGIACGLLITGGFALISYYSSKKESGGEDPTVLCGFLAVASFAVTAALGIAYMSEALAAKFAPEAWAAQQIIRRVGR